MDLQFNQYQKQNNKEYLHSLTRNLVSYYIQATFIDASKYIQNKAIQLVGGSFKKEMETLGEYHNYFIDFDIKQTTSIQNITIFLAKSDASKGKQKIKTIKIPPSSTSSLYHVSFVFNAIDNGFTQLLFELTRSVIEDNINSGLTYTPSGSQTAVQVIGRILTIENINIYEIINLFDKRLQKIGIQSSPGNRFCINGEEIHIGKSGLYEMFYDIPIYFVGAIIKNSTDLQKNYFVIDYQY